MLGPGCMHCKQMNREQLKLYVQFLVSSVLLNHLLACPYLLKGLQPVGYPFLSDNDAESYNEMLRDFVNKQELQRAANFLLFKVTH